MMEHLEEVKKELAELEPAGFDDGSLGAQIGSASVPYAFVKSALVVTFKVSFQKDSTLPE